MTLNSPQRKLDKPARLTREAREAARAMKLGPKLRVAVLDLVQERLAASAEAERLIAAHMAAGVQLSALPPGAVEPPEMVAQRLSREHLAYQRSRLLTNYDVKGLLGEFEDRWGQQRQGAQLELPGGIPVVLVRMGEGEGGDGWPVVAAGPAADGGERPINGSAH